jgi:oligopeptide/dipeptide ABC transporter ATP-binding protein
MAVDTDAERLLRVKDLYINFYTYEGVVKAIDGVSFDIYTNETFALVGETGCGKSVTARSILRLIPTPPGKIEGGEILFNGVDLLKIPEKEMLEYRGKKISMIFQEPMTSLNPVFTVGDQLVETIALNQKVNKEEAYSIALEMLERVRIPDAENAMTKYPHEFSGGQRQRIVIAMALSCNPSLLIADEPTTALDVTVQAQIINLMNELQKNMGTSILLITHDLGVVAEMSDRVAVMYAGNIVEIGTTSAIFEKRYHPYTQGLFNAIPVFGKGKQTRLEEIPGSVPNLLYPPPGCRFHPRCPHVMDICRKEKPELIEVELGHHVRCHLYR